MKFNGKLGGVDHFLQNINLVKIMFMSWLLFLVFIACTRLEIEAACRKLMEDYRLCFCSAISFLLTYILLRASSSPHNVVITVPEFGLKIWRSILHKSTAAICLEGHPEFAVLRCSSKMSVSKASVLW